MKSSKYLWWGRSWHMQTPLETLGSGSFMVFELRDLQVRRYCLTTAAPRRNTHFAQGLEEARRVATDSALKLRFSHEATDADHAMPADSDSAGSQSTRNKLIVNRYHVKSNPARSMQCPALNGNPRNLSVEEVEMLLMWPLPHSEAVLCAVVCCYNRTETTNNLTGVACLTLGGA